MAREDEADDGSSRNRRINVVREAFKLLVEIVKLVENLSAPLVRLL